MRKAFCMLILFGFLMTPAFGQQDPEQRKIEYLINSIATLHDAHFIRNGTEYSAAQAVDHLRLKLRYAGSRIKTAEEFITYCATGSSISGEPYRIKFRDGTTIAAATFFRDKLAAYPAQEHASPRTSGNPPLQP